MTRSTHTYAILDISPAAYAEIREKLERAGYQHAFHKEGEDEVIDMQGIAVRAEVPDLLTPEMRRAAAEYIRGTGSRMQINAEERHVLELVARDLEQGK